MFIDPYDLRRALRDGTNISGGGSVRFSAGILSGLRSDLTFANSNGVTFGLSNNGVITASVAPGGGGLTNIKFSAGVASELRSDITFNNGNGVSFGLNAGVITATVATNYQSAGAYLTTAQPPGAYLTTAQPPGAYLTTAMASNASTAFAGIGTSATNASITLNTAGLAISVAPPTAAAIKFSAGTLSSNVSAVTFSNGGGVSFGFDGSNITATVATNYQSIGAYLTTAQSPGAYLTTAMLSANSSLFAGTGFTTATTAGTNIVGTLNNSGLSMGIPAYLTTAAAGTGVGTNTSTATTAGTALTFGANTSGITIGYPAWLTTAGGGGTQATLSYFVHPDQAVPNNAWTTITTSISNFYVDPFILPCAASFSYLRMGASIQNSWAQYATSANQTSYSASIWTTFLIGIYTMNTGLSSNSLSQYASTSAGMTMVWSLAETGSQYTASLSVTYPVSSGTNSTSQQSAFSSGSINLSASIGPLAFFPNAGGGAFMDIPFATSFSAGNYWMMIGMNTTKSTQGNSLMGNARLQISYAGLAQLSRERLLFDAGGALLPMQLGIGSCAFSLTQLPSGQNMASIFCETSGDARIYWQGIRQA
jgi:hypothetical protein